MSNDHPSNPRSQFAIPHSPFTIFFIIFIAAFLRLYQLPALPPGLNFDEAGSGVAALEILGGAPRIWWRLGGGQEPFWPYLAALSTAVLGQTPLALRLPAALAGVLTVAAVYPLLGALFAGQNRHDRYLLALLAALGLALSDWHLHFSRLGFRAILLPLFSSLAFYFFWRSLTAGSQKSVASSQLLEFSFYSRRAFSSVLPTAALALSALFTALAIYSYLAARLLWLAPVLFLALQWLITKIKDARQLSEVKTPSPAVATRSIFLLISQFLFLLLLFLSPLMVYFLLYPADFIARSATVSIFNPEWNQGDLAGAAWRTLVATLGTFLGFRGDANPLVNLPGQPALPPLLVPFFTLGILASLYQLFTPSRPHRVSPYLFLLCWWFVMLLPALFAPEGAPHHLRLLGTIVPTYALVALGLVVAGNWLSKFPFYASRITHHASRITLHTSRLLPATYYLLTVACYLLVALQTCTNYFIRWPASTDFTLPFDLYAVRLAAEIAQAPPQVAYVLPMDIRAGAEARHYSLDYLLGLQHPAYTYLPVGEQNAGPLLTQAAQGKTELRVVRWTDDKHREADAKEIVAYLLETTARWQRRESFPVYELETYALPGPRTVFALPAITQPVGAVFSRPETGQGLLRLEAAFIPVAAPPGQWLPVALTLAPLAALDADYKVSLRLISSTGERVAQKDRLLLHNFHQGTSLWPPERVNEYYLLPIAPETPPGDYVVAVVIYHPDTLAPLLANGLAETPLATVRLE